MDDCLTEQNLLVDDSLSNNLDSDDPLHSSCSNNQLFKSITDILNFEFNESNQPKNIFQKIQSIIFYLRDEKINYHYIFTLIIFFFFLFIIFINKGRLGKRKLMVFDDSRYQIEITRYNILYDINNDSSMNVTENITISYQGIENTGFRRLIPVNNGVQIRNVRIGQIKENRIEKVFHSEYYRDGYLILDIGDYQLKYGKNESYFINYEFRILHKKIEKKNMMPLNVIGYDWQCKINNATIKLIVPAGFTEAICFEGHKKTEKFEISEKNEKKIIFATFHFLNEFEGVTFDLHFSPNSIRSYIDSYPIYYFKLTILILLIILIMSYFVYQFYNKITPIRYTSSLNTMDPLIMSKVLNGSVEKSDVTSVIFYWASEGYLNINFDNDYDPILIKNVDSLPDSMPLYQTHMFNELFRNGKVVKTSEFRFKFYKTINKVIKMVDSQTKRFVNYKSIIFSAIFANLGVFWSYAAPLNLKNCVSEEFEFSSWIFIMPFICQTILWIIRYNMNYHYLYNAQYFLLWFFFGLVCIFYFVVYFDSFPSFMISNSYKFLLSASSILCISCSTWLITKTNYFMVKIGEVFGFKQFIEHPVNEEFESFIKKDPELFYNLICYAQVLKLTDKWKNKFDSLTATPPHWMQHSHYDRFYFGDFNMINNRIAMSRTHMFHHLVVSPHQNKSGGRGSSHSSHSHGGHGFGGGGGHGR